MLKILFAEVLYNFSFLKMIFFYQNLQKEFIELGFWNVIYDYWIWDRA